MLTAKSGHREAIRACVADLHDNGIDLSHARHAECIAFVHQHLDYFQLMMGTECAASEIVGLLEEESRSVTPAGALRSRHQHHKRPSHN
jgi:hypothetical protein